MKMLIIELRSEKEGCEREGTRQGKHEKEKIEMKFEQNTTRIKIIKRH
jgi:hypothetical protein